MIEDNLNLKDLLQGIMKGDVSQSEAIFAKNEVLLTKSKITKEDLKEKFRLIKITNIADDHQQMTFAELAKELCCSVDEVEFLFISSIEFGFIDALIDQNTQSVFFRYSIFYNKIQSNNIQKSPQKKPWHKRNWKHT